MKNSAVSIGTFDGVHLGHRALIKKLLGVSRQFGLKSILLVFPKPIKKVSGVLTTLPEKIKLLKTFGLDEVIVLGNTDKIINQSAGIFFDKFLKKELGARHFVVGSNFAFGKGREGNISWLKEKCAQDKISMDVVHPLKKLDRMVSSSIIRGLVEAGDMKHAAALLGRFYFVSGRHVGGKRLGRKLGFPTVNLSVEPGKLLPRGIFAGLIEDGVRLLPSAVFIGERSTVSNTRKVFPEAYILDFKGTWRRKDVKIHLLKRIRAEKKFHDVIELKQRITKDVELIRTYFK